MKKIISLAALLTIPALTACDNTKERNTTQEDYMAIEKAASQAEPVILGFGDRGDYIMKIKKTEEIEKIANKNRTVKFLSAENPAQYVEEGYCLVNLIPEPVMASIDPVNTCYFRLTCGSAEEINNEKYYAVELCRY